MIVIQYFYTLLNCPQQSISKPIQTQLNTLKGSYTKIKNKNNKKNKFKN